MAWIIRLVKIGAEGEGRALDVMEINRPDDLSDIADLGLTLDETKRLLGKRCGSHTLPLTSRV